MTFCGQPYTWRTLWTSPTAFLTAFFQWAGHWQGQVHFWCFWARFSWTSCHHSGDTPTPRSSCCSWRLCSPHWLHKPSTVSKYDEILSSFHPTCSYILAPLHGQASGKRQAIYWPGDCLVAFKKAKKALSDSLLLHHPCPGAPTSLTVDVSNSAVNAQLRERQGQSWLPLTFFSQILPETENKYSALTVSSRKLTVL